MGCAIIDIEVTKPLPRLSLNEGQTGFAVIIRRKGKPVGFWLDAPAAERILEPDELGRRIIAEAGQDLLAEAVREEMASPSSAACPSVTIAICTKDRPDDLAGLLTSLQDLHRRSGPEERRAGDRGRGQRSLRRPNPTDGSLLSGHAICAGAQTGPELCS